MKPYSNSSTSSSSSSLSLSGTSGTRTIRRSPSYAELFGKNVLKAPVTTYRLFLPSYLNIGMPPLQMRLQTSSIDIPIKQLARRTLVSEHVPFPSSVFLTCQYISNLRFLQLTRLDTRNASASFDAMELHRTSQVPSQKGKTVRKL